MSGALKPDTLPKDFVVWAHSTLCEFLPGVFDEASVRDIICDPSFSFTDILGDSREVRSFASELKRRLGELTAPPPTRPNAAFVPPAMPAAQAAPAARARAPAAPRASTSQAFPPPSAGPAVDQQAYTPVVPQMINSKVSVIIPASSQRSRRTKKAAAQEPASSQPASPALASAPASAPGSSSSAGLLFPMSTSLMHPKVEQPAPAEPEQPATPEPAPVLTPAQREAAAHLEAQQTMKEVQRRRANLQRRAQRIELMDFLAASADVETPVVNGICGCMATEHPVLCNCLSCGRILCVREAPAADDAGDAKCPACEEPLSDNQSLIGRLAMLSTQRKLLRSTKAPGKGRRDKGGKAAAAANAAAAATKPSSDSHDEVQRALEGAILVRDAQVERGKKNAKRSVIRDLDTDYFAADSAATMSYLSDTQKERLREAQDRLLAVLEKNRSSFASYSSGHIGKNEGNARTMLLDLDLETMSVNITDGHDAEVEKAKQQYEEEYASILMSNREDIARLDEIAAQNLQRARDDLIKSMQSKNSAEFPDLMDKPARQKPIVGRSKLSVFQDDEEDNALARAADAAFAEAEADTGSGLDTEADPPAALDCRLPKTFSAQDFGKCIAFPQPWASLIARGVVPFAYSDQRPTYRGPVWIASNSNTEPKDRLKAITTAVIDHYTANTEPIDRPHHSNDFIFYTGNHIYGRVEIVDIITREEFAARYPHLLEVPYATQSNMSGPYVFLFRNPESLYKPVPVDPSFSIWDLPMPAITMLKEMIERSKVGVSFSAMLGQFQ